MEELLTVVTRKGQITVPAEIRRVLDIKVGDKVALYVRDVETREVGLRPVKSVADATFGAIRPRRRPEDLRALRRAYQEDVAEEVAAEGMRERASGVSASKRGVTRRKR